MPPSDIIIRGAREHNLRGVDLVLPRNKLIVMTGVSGSGKSSLAFDTIYAEGQRRYVESLSTYARQFLGQMPKPEVDAISGLAPSISIQQKATSRNPRSTVGTITEIYDYLRVLFARVGAGYCARCGSLITAQSTDQILERISALPEGTRFQVLAPIVTNQKGEFRDLFADLLKQGFLRARVDGQIVNLSDDLGLKKHFKHNIDVVIDRLTAGRQNRGRLAEAVESAIRLSGGAVIVDREIASGNRPLATQAVSATGIAPSETDEDEAPPATSATDLRYSAKYACSQCGVSYEPPSPQLFSFNSPLGMCTHCNGLGARHDFRIDQLVEDGDKSLFQGALNLLGPIKKIGRWRKHIFEGVAKTIESLDDLPSGAFLKTPWNELPDAARDHFLNGTGDKHITFAYRHSGGVWKHGGTWAGFVTELLDDYRKARNPMRRRQLEKYMDFVPCTVCHGTRLNEQARSVRITSRSAPPVEELSAAPARKRRGKSTVAAPQVVSGESPAATTRALSLPEVCGLTIEEARDFFGDLILDDTQQFIANDCLKEITGRLGFLLRCGLNYLSLDRTAPTLSGGESQRIRLAGQIGCGLVGVLYILDEPSIGLHPRDNTKLLESLCDLRDQGNTVIVVEHDEETMRAADHIVDFGPGPGVRGGEVVAQGAVSAIEAEPRSVTGQFLIGARAIEIPKQRRKPGKGKITLSGARHHNLKGVDVEFPLGEFIVITGVSGSGKSSLINDILWQVLKRDVNKKRGKGKPDSAEGESRGDNGDQGEDVVVAETNPLDQRFVKVTGLDLIDKAIDIDQSPIGRTPRSNPATYVKLLDEIRVLYAQLPQAKVRGYTPGRFSFNVADGRCEACEGHGATKLEMDFLADIWVTCAVCEGKRFNHETLEVKYKDKSIADVLNMDVQEALEHFQGIPKIRQLLQTLHDVGLDYMKLGQPSPTLSGGEAQRVKLARELGKRSTGKTVYLLDEPTTGLHFEDVRKLLEVLHGFVDAGNTVIVVEHSLDVVKTADYVIDMGPEGGRGGGRVVACGTPEDIAACGESHTGRALRPILTQNGERGSVSPVTPATNNGRSKKKSAAPKVTSAARITSPPAAGLTHIAIRGARQHNLQDVDLDIPRDEMSVFCGPSGSGKSSLAMDTLYAEGQRRYVESLSAYARQFLGQMPKPRVEYVHGLSPAIAIEQKTVGSTPRSTVGTVTEVYDYLRVLFARLGQMHCPDCGAPVTRQTTDEIIARVLSAPNGARLYVAAPVEVPVGQTFEKLWDRLATQGFVRVRIDGQTYPIEDIPKIDHRRAHDLEVIIDRLKVDQKVRSRIGDSIEAALDLGKGVVHVIHLDDGPEDRWKRDRLSLHFSCPNCG
ncbi:UvrABC system protein A [Caulifigura coniformis]|uniref:UvrABC system protein A n=1 Tax=Caulifigura coniformis TaxID=2527983 RepID=A0A517SCU6_9PLAN|nr:excinuclease ABC subunit UvrA [Caulifigura coniformis]QDT53943.1 UvrABC system protein A [Caulifigura coniformis]